MADADYSTRALDTACDLLNAAYSRAEGALRDLGINVSASVPINLGRGGFLHYAKIEDTWGLYYARTSSAVELSPIARCSRAVRVAAAPALRRLYVELEATSKRDLDAVREATQAVCDFVVSITTTCKE